MDTLIEVPTIRLPAVINSDSPDHTIVFMLSTYFYVSIVLYYVVEYAFSVLLYRTVSMIAH